MAPSESPMTWRSGRWAAPIGSDNRLVRAVGRVPLRLRAKFVVGFTVIAVLLVVGYTLGLAALGQSNSRVERLGKLQQRESQYQTISTQANVLRQLLGLRSGGGPGFAKLTHARSVPTPAGLVRVDEAIREAASLLSTSTNQVQIGFVPPPADERVLTRIRRDFAASERALSTLRTLDAEGVTGAKPLRALQQAHSVVQDLLQRANHLSSTTNAQTDALIADNRSAYTSSRNLFIAVSAGSLLLALALGLVLS